MTNDEYQAYLLRRRGDAEELVVGGLVKSRKNFEAALDDLESCARHGESTTNHEIAEQRRAYGVRVRAELLEWFDETQSAIGALAMAVVANGKPEAKR